MGGLAKGLAIIEAFTAQRPQLTVTEATRATGATPAAARRCLLTLAALGYVSYDGKYFRPAPRMARLGSSFAAISPLPALAQPCLEAVRDETQESSSLAVMDREFVAIIARAEAERIVTTSVRLGVRLPIHASATGRVLLAGLPDDELEEKLRHCVLKRTTPNTLMTIPEIRDRIEQVRAEGVAYTDEELEMGVRTMAVPVRDVMGNTHAAMSVATLVTRVSLEEMDVQFRPVLLREAARLGAML